MRRGAAPLAAGLLALVGCLAVGLGVQLHEPETHDEWSYLLLADTLAHGRLANATPPHWPHFETFHVLMEPTYASKYPPGQGAVLALGQRVLGHPMAGVWLASALLCAAVAWMLLAFVPPAWAWAGAAIVVVQYSVAGPWSHSYWGGALAGFAGALVLGGLRRVLDQPTRSATTWLALGLAILATTRPLEGAFFALPVGILFLHRLLRGDSEVRRALWKRAVPILVTVGMLTLGWLGYYDWRVTGDPLTTPYGVHTAAYSPTPLLVFGSPRPRPEYRHERIARFHTVWEANWFVQQHTLPKLLRAIPWKVRQPAEFFVGSVGWIPLLALPWVLRDRWYRFLAGTIGILLLQSLFVSTYGGRPHYLAPATGAWVALQVEGLRQLLAVSGWRRRVGGVLALVFVVGTGAGLVQRVRDHAVPDDHWTRRRANLVARLETDPQPDLVVVRYAPQHSVHLEWVYNGAELGEEPVLFARSMGRERDRTLVAAHPDRRAWLLTVESHQREHLEPFEEEAGR